MAEWKEKGSLRGPQGPQGETGPQGPQGPQGETGPQGPAGADAQFPTGGTDGQSLVKDGDGYSWADMLPTGGGTLTGNLAVDTGTTEPNVTVKRAVDGGSTAAEGVMRIDSDGVVGIRAKVAGQTVNNLYLEQTKTRLSKPLDVASGGVPQDGTTGQILKKGANGAEWVDSIVVDTTDAAVAMRDSAAVVDDPANPTSGIVLKTDDTGNTVISGIDGVPVDEVHVEDTTGDSTGTLAVNVDSMKAYVQDHAGDALPEGGTTGQVLTKTADGEAWQDAPEPDLSAYATTSDLSGLLKADFTGIEKLDANTVDISTLGPGTYLLSAVAQGTDDYNETLFPDEMVYGNPDSGTCILNVYGGFSGTGRKHLELFVIKSVGSGSRYYATTDTTGTLLSKDSWNTDKINLSDTVAETNTSNAVTGKAVADYVAANAGSGLPEGGTTGQVLTKTATGTEWADAAGGGGLELLWEGNITTYQSQPAQIPVDTRTYDVLFIYGLNNNNPNHRFVLPVKPVEGFVGTIYYSGEDNVFVSVKCTTVTIIEAQFYGLQIVQLYGLKASGGGQ